MKFLRAKLTIIHSVIIASIQSAPIDGLIALVQRELIELVGLVIIASQANRNRTQRQRQRSNLEREKSFAALRYCSCLLILIPLQKAVQQ